MNYDSNGKPIINEETIERRKKAYIRFGFMELGDGFAFVKERKYAFPKCGECMFKVVFVIQDLLFVGKDESINVSAYMTSYKGTVFEKEKKIDILNRKLCPVNIPESAIKLSIDNVITQVDSQIRNVLGYETIG